MDEEDKPRSIGRNRMWQPGPLDKLRSFMLSITFQAAIQTATGMLMQIPALPSQQCRGL